MLGNMQTRDYHIVPRHIALIMDGNGRWACSRGLVRTDGHRAGAEHMLDIVRACLDLGVQYLTLYIFSTENWKRPRNEVDGMLHLVAELLDRELWTIHTWNVRLRHLGRLNGLPGFLQQRVDMALELTRNNSGMTLSVALNYSGRADLVDAVRTLIEKGIPAEEIDEQMIAAHLSTWMLPDPDLVIRTSGEQRLSNFLLWECATCRFWSTPVFWPDFTPSHLHQAISASAR